jgi:hypothetical protein
MASQFQGFNIVLNLSESDQPDSDRNIINNLGGGTIADDLLTLYNNLRNFSVITVESTDISGSQITKEDAQFVYTNGTKVTVGSTVYYVKDSDGKTHFKLSTLPNLSTTVASPPTGDYIRSDAIALENFDNLVVQRPRTIEDFSRSRLYDNYSSLSNDELYQLSTSLVAMVAAADVGDFPSRTSGYLTSVNTLVDNYELVSDKAIVRNEDFFISTPITLNGSLEVVDTANTNATILPPSSNPGLFILNPKTGAFARAFSSSENVWEQVGSDLVVDSPNIIMGDLSFTGPNGINLISKDSAILVEPVVPSANLAFTHTVDVSINGETYSLCLFT